jgi:rod shape-determining protein MreD
MRWLTFLILAVLTVSLQTTVASRLVWFQASPDWVLVLVVFYALHARADQAVAAGWVVGALADLLTIERFGLLSLTYGLIAAAVCMARAWMFTRHPLTHFGVTFAAALAAAFAWSAYRAALGIPGQGFLTSGWWCVYTALWAPPLHWLLLKAPGLLGLRTLRRWSSPAPRARQQGV